MLPSSEQLSLSTLLESERAWVPANINGDELTRGGGTRSASWCGAVRIVRFNVCVIRKEKGKITSKRTAKTGARIPVVIARVTTWSGRRIGGERSVMRIAKVDIAMPLPGESSRPRDTHFI